MNKNFSSGFQNISGGVLSDARHAIRATKADAEITDLLTHLRSELTIPFGEIAALATQLESISVDRFKEASVADHQLCDKLAATSRKAAGFIRSLSELRDLLADECLPGDERMLLLDIFNEISGEVAHISLQHGVALRLEESDSELSAVYGSSRWIRLVLQQLIANLVISPPMGSCILFRLRQVGAHQLVSGTVHHGHPITASRDLITDGSRQHSADVTPPAPGKQLYLAIIHAVIELHGGMFKFESAEDGSLFTFKFILPTDAPWPAEQRSKLLGCPIRPQ